MNLENVNVHLGYIRNLLRFAAIYAIPSFKSAIILSPASRNVIHVRFGHCGDPAHTRDLSQQMHLQVTQRSSILRRYGSCMCYTCCRHISGSASILQVVLFTSPCFILRIRCGISLAWRRAFCSTFEFKLYKLLWKFCCVTRKRNAERNAECLRGKTPKWNHKVIKTMQK